MPMNGIIGILCTRMNGPHCKQCSSSSAGSTRCACCLPFIYIVMIPFFMCICMHVRIYMHSCNAIHICALVWCNSYTCHSYTCHSYTCHRMHSYATSHTFPIMIWFMCVCMIWFMCVCMYICIDMHSYTAIHICTIQCSLASSEWWVCVWMKGMMRVYMHACYNSNESCHIWMSHVTYEWVTSHMNESCHTCMHAIIRLHIVAYLYKYIQE